MFDFILFKDGEKVLERYDSRGEIVVAALQLLSAGEMLNVKISDRAKREKTNE